MICVEAEVAIVESKWFLERALVSLGSDGGGQIICYQSSWKVHHLYILTIAVFLFYNMPTWPKFSLGAPMFLGD